MIYALNLLLLQMVLFNQIAATNPLEIRAQRNIDKVWLNGSVSKNVSIQQFVVQPNENLCYPIKGYRGKNFRYDLFLDSPLIEGFFHIKFNGAGGTCSLKGKSISGECKAIYLTADGKNLTCQSTLGTTEYTHIQKKQPLQLPLIHQDDICSRIFKISAEYQLAGHTIHLTKKDQGCIFNKEHHCQSLRTNQDQGHLICQNEKSQQIFSYSGKSLDKFYLQQTTLGRQLASSILERNKFFRNQSKSKKELQKKYQKDAKNTAKNKVSSEKKAKKHH